MAYTSGTETSDASATATLVNRIETALTAHSAWEYVEEVTEGGYTSRVWKNKGTENDFGSDWYLALMRTSDTSDLTFKAAEDWDGSLAYRGCANPSNTYTPGATYASAYESAGYSWSSTNINGYVKLSTNTTSFSWKVHINSKRLIVQTAVGTTVSNIIYTGIFDVPEPFASASYSAMEFPLCVAPILGDDFDSNGSTSRRPQSVGMSLADCFATDTRYSPNYQYLYQYFVSQATGQVGNVATVPPIGTRIYLKNSDNHNGGHRGIFSDIAMFYSAGLSSIGGDTITISGSSYVSLNNYGYGTFWVPND